MIKLNEWKGDNLHIDSDIGNIDGHNKTWNLIVTERESGKSTLLWKKVYNAFRRNGAPSIVFRRYQTDITDMYIEDVEKLINKFTGSGIKFDYKRADLKAGGQMDLKINNKTFCRIIALNTPLSRLKSMFLSDVRYMMFDEFICNRRLGEKYLEDEPFRIKELYTTYNRETDKISIYMFGNPYSLFNPFFASKNVPTNKLFPGAFVVGDDYVVWCYQIKPELKEAILKKNSLYQFDDAYKKYAFDGRAVQDADIKIETSQPQNFKLEFVLKLHKKCIGIYHGYIFEPEKLFYWAKLIDEKTISKRRDIVCFDFGEMASRTVLANTQMKQTYSSLRESIEHRWIAYASIEESWLIEEIYQNI